MGGLAKYDSKFKDVELVHKDSVSRKELFQRSTYTVGIKFNLLHGLASPYPHHLISEWFLNVGYNYVGSQVRDTSFKDQGRTIIDTTFRTTIQNEWYIEPMVTLNRNRNFALSLSIPFHSISLRSSEKIKNKEVEYWTIPSLELMYYGKKDVGNKLFFRYRRFLNLSDQTQAFSQMQLGYSLNLTSV